MRSILPKYCLKEFWPMASKEGRDKIGNFEEPQEFGELCYSDEYVFETKWDGGRYTAVEGRLFSRHEVEINGRPMGYPVEKTNQLPHVASFFEEFPGTWFDMEVLRPGGRSDDVTSVLGCVPEKAIARQKELGYLHIQVFDVIAMDYKSTIEYEWQDRRAILEKFFAENATLINAINKQFGGVINLSEVHVGTDAKIAAMKKVLATGLEGVMAKNIHSDYHPGKRPVKHWYKAKKHITDDVVIMGFTDGEGKFAGMIGSVVFGQYKGDKLVMCGACSGMDDAQRQLITANKDYYKGKVIEIEAMERTKAGLFRHPQWKQLRLDKNASMCKWGER